VTWGSGGCPLSLASGDRGGVHTMPSADFNSSAGYICDTSPRLLVFSAQRLRIHRFLPAKNETPNPPDTIGPAPIPKKPEPPGWYECLFVPGDATAAYRDSMAAYNNARPSSGSSDDDTSANGVGGGPVLLNLTGKSWAPQGNADAATKVNGAAAAADYVVSAGGCFAQ
jgi:hypothetical protein